MIQSHPFSIMECKVFSFRSSILHMVFVSFICSCTRECGMNFISIEIEFVHVSAHFSTCYTVLGALFIDAHDVRKPCERFGFRQVKNIFLMIWYNVKCACEWHVVLSKYSNFEIMRNDKVIHRGAPLDATLFIDWQLINERTVLTCLHSSGHSYLIEKPSDFSVSACHHDFPHRCHIHHATVFQYDSNHFIIRIHFTVPLSDWISSNVDKYREGKNKQINYRVLHECVRGSRVIGFQQ